MKRNVWVRLIVSTILVCGGMNLCGAEKKEGIEDKVLNILNGHGGWNEQEIAALGSSTVPVLLDVLENNRFDWPGSVVGILGMIRDNRATPLLLRILREEFVFTTRYKVSKSTVLRALGRIADSRAETEVLDIFEDENESPDIRLLAGQVLCKVGGEESKAKVKQLIGNFHILWQKAYRQQDETAKAELERMKMDWRHLETFGEQVPPVYLALRDVEIFRYTLRYRLVDLSGPGGANEKEALRILTEIATAEALEIVYQLAENSTEMQPDTRPPGHPEKDIPSATRISAVESLLAVPGVDMERLQAAFESIPVEELLEIPVTVKFQPDKWNLQWRKEHEGKGTINCYIGNIPGNDGPSAIVPSSIKLSDIGIEGKSKVLKNQPGFIGEVLAVKFNKFEVMKALWETGIWPGKESDITITGEFSNGKHFRGTGRITIAPVK